MEETLKYIVEHWSSIIEILFAVVGLASLIVKLTPSPKDDEVVGKVAKAISKSLKVLDVIALNPKQKKEK